MPSAENVDDVDAGQHQAGNHGGGKQRADRFVENIGEQDQDQAGWNDLAQRAGSADNAAGQPLVVAAAQQRRQREQAERHDGGANDAGCGAHENADDDDADTEPATQVSGRVRDHVHQLFRELGFFQHHAHEDEQRHGDQRVVCHHAEDAAWKQIEQQRAEADIAKHQTGRRQRQSNRDARQQQDEEPDQHQDGENFIKRHSCALLATPGNTGSPAPAIAKTARRTRGESGP